MKKKEEEVKVIVKQHKQDDSFNKALAALKSYDLKMRGKMKDIKNQFNLQNKPGFLHQN